MSGQYGVMVVGLCGHLSTTTLLGAAALSKGLCPSTGMVSALERFNHVPFADISDFCFGGWDIRPCSDARMILQDAGIADPSQAQELLKTVDDIQSRTFPGILLNAGEAISNLSEAGHVVTSQSITDLVEQVKTDIAMFKKENQVENLTVVNLASTEPTLPNRDSIESIKAIEALIKNNQASHIRPSFIYAYAAITSGCAYINFTPSEAGMSQGLVDLAGVHHVPVMGSDGKTGETLVKSSLAPMFAMRNLDVMSWEGYNILGNMDGRILQNDENGATKIKSKDRLLPHILGYTPHSKVSIDYVPSLGDRKTAWDFIHFQGFLNTRMSLQFTWQGCDSALAAPLVLDLARFAFLALENGEHGAMKQTASFFKSPWKVDEHALERQFRLLEDYCEKFKSG